MSPVCWLLLASLILSLIPCQAQSTEGETVVVVYNKRMKSSRQVAEHYAKARNIPDKQVIGFRLPEKEIMGRVEFRKELQLPLAKELEKRGLFEFEEVPPEAPAARGKKGLRKVSASSIRYLVLCRGVPLKIAPLANLVEEGQESLPSVLRRNESAVDNELAALPVLEMHPILSGPLVNPHYRTTNSFSLHPTNGVLMVSRLDGPTPELAMGLVDKALQAEKDGLWGRAYYDLRGIQEGSYRMGDDWLRRAAELTRKAGFETQMDTAAGVFGEGFPLSNVALYAGWYTEQVSGPFKQAEIEFLPGAFAYHLHSFSAATVRENRHWVGPLVTKGVTSTMGCVYEPYLGATPDIETFAGRYLYLGFSFGEAAYASLNSLSWQTTVIGDPLFRPFRLHPRVQHSQMIRTGNKMQDWSLLRLVNLGLISGWEDERAIKVLTNDPLTSSSALLLEKLANLHLGISKNEEALNYLEQASERNSSTQQAIRLLLARGKLLIQLERPKEAGRVFDHFLKTYPKYPSRKQVEDLRRKVK